MRGVRLSLVVAVVAGLLTLAMLLTASPPIGPLTREPSARAVERPNIVFVLTDDLSMNLLPYLPQVRAMQRDGTTLSHYYVVDSLCCPSRASIFTGEYPHDTGVFENAGAQGGYAAYNRNNDESRSFALSLQQAGYRTGFMGKYLNGYVATDPPPPGWDTWDAVGNGYREFGYDMNVDGAVEHFGEASKDYLTDVLSRKAVQFVGAAAHQGRPFMLEVATFAPHNPFTPAPRDAQAYPGLRYPRTAAYGHVPSDPPAWLAARGALTPQEDALIDGAFRKRAQAVLAVDDMIARLRAALKASHVARDTYLVFSSDNGYHMGENRLLPGKQTAFDTDIHVPLVVVGPGVPAGRTMPQLASSIDLAPTFESLAGTSSPATVDGTSLVGLWHGRSPRGWQRAVLVEHRRPGSTALDPDRQTTGSGAPPTYEAVRTASALYVRYADGAQEYYDTTTDPQEQHNLASGGVPLELVMTLASLQGCHGQQQCQAAAQAQLP